MGVSTQETMSQNVTENNIEYQQMRLIDHNIFVNTLQILKEGIGNIDDLTKAIEKSQRTGTTSHEGAPQRTQPVWWNTQGYKLITSEIKDYKSLYNLSQENKTSLINELFPTNEHEEPAEPEDLGNPPPPSTLKEEELKTRKPAEVIKLAVEVTPERLS
ncbi:hypothetical protein JTB14_025774 [Gonioctena quinquepunctata]|nr:hypothetical protein JTB14_025774 [Gonioctena quinquepunctata]